MGSGFKNFVAGNVLSEADLDGYLMRQTVMTFASSTARDTALSGVLDEGMMAYLEDVDQVTYYNGSNWRPWLSQWTSFTPVWTNLTVGNGTNTGFYRYNGRSMDVRARILLGSTSAVSTPVSFALPNSETAGASGVKTVGNVWFEDATGTDSVGTCQVNGASSSCFIYTTAIVSISSTSPFTWTTSDALSVSIDNIPLAA